MKINFILKRLKQHYSKAGAKKHIISFFIIALSFFILLSWSFSIAAEDKVFTTIKTKCGGQEYEFETDSSTIEEGLRGTPCQLGEKDITYPPKESNLEGGEQEVFITKALPVTVYDGSSMPRFGKSIYIDPREILKDIGIEAYPEDIIKSDLIVSNFWRDGIGKKITIKRAPTIYVTFDGEKKEFHSWKETVGEVLSDNSVSLGSKDKISPKQNTEVKDEMEVVITRVKIVEKVEKEAIPYNTVTRNDNSMFIGESKVRQSGINGEVEKTYKVTYENGEEVSRNLISEETLKKPQDKIVVKGAKPYDAGYLWEIMVDAEKEYGISANKLYRVAKCESRLNPNSTNSSGGYYGLFQFSLGLWNSASREAGFPGANWNNGRAQIYTTAYLVSKEGSWSRWPHCGYL